jgi:hypothetical protein
MSEVVVPGIEKINNKMTKIMEGDNKWKIIKLMILKVSKLI